MQLGGKTVFPITLGNGPPLDGTCPDNGLKGWTEVARAGVKMLRIYPKWSAANAAAQITDVKGQLIAASRFGLRLWVGLYDVANDLSKQALLAQIVDGLKDHPGLGAWKGCDEPLLGKRRRAGRRRRLRLHPFARPGPSDRDHPGTEGARRHR